jgi:hypothetical protein
VGTGSSRTEVAVDHQAVAAVGVRVYLEGLARVLGAWLLQLQGMSSSGGKAASAKQSSGGSRADKGIKKAKKQRQQ